jgi:hypothetical protein
MAAVRSIPLAAPMIMLNLPCRFLQLSIAILCHQSNYFTQNHFEWQRTILGMNYFRVDRPIRTLFSRIL